MPIRDPLVVNPGSKIRARFSSVMPTPVSAISTATSSASGRVRSVRVPRPSMAWVAFTIRFMNTWWIWFG